jgi:hypothetical protein
MTASIKELNTYINRLTSEEKRDLALALKKQLVVAEARMLSAIKPRKKIPMHDIVKEIRIVRKTRRAKKKQYLIPMSG